MKKLEARKKADTNFVLLSQSRNMIGRFMKTYLHRPIKILQFFTPGRIQKCLSRAYHKGFSYMLFLFEL